MSSFHIFCGQRISMGKYILGVGVDVEVVMEFWWEMVGGNG